MQPQSRTTSTLKINMTDKDETPPFADTLVVHVQINAGERFTKNTMWRYKSKILHHSKMLPHFYKAQTSR